MKKATIIITIFMLSLAFTTKSAELIGGLVFPDYQLGKVYFKNTGIVDAYLNYSIINKQMLFKRNEQVLALGLVETIDSIVISGRTFIYHEDEEFLEKIASDNGNLYIQYIATMIIKGKEAGFGGYSQVSKVTSLSSIGVSGDGSGGDLGRKDFVSGLSTNDQTEAKISTAFWLKRGNSFTRLITKNSVINFFPKSKKNQIQSYFDTHKVNFELLDDVKELMAYCYSL